MANISRGAAIVGVAESDDIGYLDNNKSDLQLHAEAAYNALEDAGLKKSDVDAIFASGNTLGLAEHMGIQPKFTDGTSVGGASFVIHAGHALAAISAGYCEVALVTHGSAGYSRRFYAPPATVRDNSPGAQFETPYGFIGAPINYAMACSRYMHEFGEERTREAMAEIAVATRKWAKLNPKALIHDPKAQIPLDMSFDDYHNSRWVCWPFHLLDCCLVTDAGGAYIISTPERARDLKKPPVWILGAGEGHDHGMISQMPSLTSLIARETGPKAFQMAGVKHSDFDLAMIYDSFTYTVMLTLESLGFCGRGEAADFVKGQRTAPGGDFPMNTAGGGLSYTHPGAYGVFLIIEAVRQLRGEGGDRQVPNCNLTFCHGTGGSLSSGGTVVLASD